MENLPSKKQEESLQILNSLIKNIVQINENTVGIELDKNIVLFNHENILTISKKNNIVIGETIHLNPNINMEDFYKNPEKLDLMLQESIVEEKESLFTRTKIYIKNKYLSIFK